MWAQLPKDLNHRSSDRNLDALNRIQEFYAEGFVEEIEIDRMIELRALFELIASNLLLRLALWRRDRAKITVRIPKRAKPVVSDAV